MEQKLTMDQYKLKDLMDATKIDVGKEVVEKLLPQLYKKLEDYCLIKVYEC